MEPDALVTNKESAFLIEKCTVELLVTFMLYLGIYVLRARFSYWNPERKSGKPGDKYIVVVEFVHLFLLMSGSFLNTFNNKAQPKWLLL